MKTINKDLIQKVRELALEYDMNPATTITKFMNYEAEYVYKHKGYTTNKINELSQKAFDIYTRYMRMTYKR